MRLRKQEKLSLGLSLRLWIIKHHEDALSGGFSFTNLNAFLFPRYLERFELVGIENVWRVYVTRLHDGPVFAFCIKQEN